MSDENISTIIAVFGAIVMLRVLRDLRRKQEARKIADLSSPEKISDDLDAVTDKEGYEFGNSIRKFGLVILLIIPAGILSSILSTLFQVAGWCVPVSDTMTCNIPFMPFDPSTILTSLTLFAAFGFIPLFVVGSIFMAIGKRQMNKARMPRPQAGIPPSPL